MRLVVTVCLLMPFAVFANGLGGPRASVPQIAATVTTNDTLPGTTVPSNFVGIGIGTCTDLMTCTGAGGNWQPPLPPQGSYLKASNTALSNALGLIGNDQIITVAGNACDYAPMPTPTTQQLTDLAAFQAATGWKLIYCLCIRCRDSAAAAAIALSVANAVGVGNVTFMLGQEPTFQQTFPNYALTPPAANFTPWPGAGATDFYTTWDSYRTAVRAAVPTATFTGPDFHGSAITFVGDFCPAVNETGLATYTYHQFPLGSGTSNPLATVFNMLTSSYETRTGIPLPSTYGPTVAAAAAACGSGLPYTMLEQDVVFTGGHLVADVLPVAIWAIDYGMALFHAGFSHWSLNGGFSDPTFRATYSQPPLYYAPITQSLSSGAVSVHPLFYGLMALGAIEGGQELPTTSPGPSGAINVKGYGFKGADTVTRLLVVNRDMARTATVTIGRTSAWTSASVKVLTGNGCYATDNITYGGAQVASDGTFSPSPITVNNGSTFNLPPCSGALAVFQ